MKKLIKFKQQIFWIWHGQKLVEKFLSSLNFTDYTFCGGYKEAERKVVIVYPSKLESLIKEGKIDFDEWIKVLRLTLPNENKGKYEHKTYLGALIKLGLKREKIGDIIVDENGCDIIIDKDILSFLELNLTQLTRFQKSNLAEISFNQIRNLNIKKEQIKITVSSMRLDNIVSELTRCSRSKAAEIIAAERVFLNFECITKQTKEIKENDRITIRGKGRFIVKQIIGNTRKGRFIIIVEK